MLNQFFSYKTEVEKDTIGNSQISVSPQQGPRRLLLPHRREEAHFTTPRLKFALLRGRDPHTTVKRICGVWESFYMSSLPERHRMTTILNSWIIGAFR